jgi:hypothetical protein
VGRRREMEDGKRSERLGWRGKGSTQQAALTPQAGRAAWCVGTRKYGVLKCGKDGHQAAGKPRKTTGGKWAKGGPAVNGHLTEGGQRYLGRVKLLPTQAHRDPGRAGSRGAAGVIPR